jgi:hypothetical protein
MTWNHRVVRKRQDGETWLGIHEVFYDLPDESGPAWTNDPIEVVGETIEELRDTLNHMLACLDKPIIDDTA